MNVIDALLGTPLGFVMRLCYETFQNYGLSIIVFTLLTKVILMPLSVWVQKNSIKMIKLQPKINEIEAQYIGQKQKVMENQLALYKAENYHPMLSLIPMAAQILVVLGLIGVVYKPLQYLLRFDANTIALLEAEAKNILGIVNTGSSFQLKIIELVQNPAFTNRFAALQSETVDISAKISQILAFNTQFAGLDLLSVPSFSEWTASLCVPLFTGLSALLMSYFQNRINVLQKEQIGLEKWGMALFLTAFSVYFGSIVPVGVGLYWICGNLFSILVLYTVNLIFAPHRYIDYNALEESKIILAKSKEIEIKLRLTKEQKKKSKEDYKRFLDANNQKKLVFYSEKSGFYKYFRAVIEYILQHSEIVIHYVTSDPNDLVFQMNEPRIIPYFIDDKRLIMLFMQIDADIVVMTTPDLQNFHLKRSYIRKNIEYIYIPHGPTSTNMCVRKGAYDHYDTFFCVGKHQADEIRETEKMYDLPAKNLVPCGYGLLDELRDNYNKNKNIKNVKPQILIAPSYQEDNIMDICLKPLLDQLVTDEFITILRPHPQYIRLYPGKVEQILETYKPLLSDSFIIQTDFSNNSTIFQSDIVITDWSGIAHEFSYTTLRPSLFINTPMKVINPEYVQYDNVPLEISLRDKIGVSVDLDHIDTVRSTVRMLLAQKEEFAKEIASIVDTYVYSIGESGAIGGRYILERLG